MSHQLSDFFQDLFSGVTKNVVEQSREGCPTPPHEGDTAGPASWLMALGHAQTAGTEAAGGIGLDYWT